MKTSGRHNLTGGSKHIKTGFLEEANLEHSCSPKVGEWEAGPVLRQLPWQADPMGPKNTVFKGLLDINWKRGRVCGGCGGTGLSWAPSVYILQP